MSDLVERLRDDNSDYVYTERHEAAARIKELEIGLCNAQGDVVAACSRIQALETSLAEAEGRVIAEVVAWCLREMYEPFTPLERAKALKSIATALETGEWRNAQSV